MEKNKSIYGYARWRKRILIIKMLVYKSEVYMHFTFYVKSFEKSVDFMTKSVYNRKACKISDEVRCGYIL